VKEIVTSKTENKNEIYYSVERQIKGKNDLFFKPEAVFQIITSPKQVIKAEKNVYTVLLYYPIYLTSEWNINEVNGQEPKIAEIVENGKLPPALITEKNIIKVLGDSTNNEVSYLVDCHIFAKNIGLIYEEKTNIEYCQESAIDNPNPLTNCFGKKIKEVGKREFITLLAHGKVK
jgi:DNA replicative helicase MCM subunit Mcm2 (Cdc46/Mcm family)